MLRMTDTRDTGGFTLLEIMVSLTLISIVFVSLFKLQSSTIHLAEYGKFQSSATLLARQAITMAERDIKQGSTLSGNFGEAFPGYEWQARISDYPSFDSTIIPEKTAERLKRIDIEITYGDNIFTATTWRYLDSG
jgi:general secretion pathway protein I